MFRVASGLESMVIGEAQVLGQFKAAHRVATEAGTIDARLDYVMRRAISTAKRVRTETALGRGSASLSEVAVECARASCEDLDGKGVLLVGAGKMSRLAARPVARRGGADHDHVARASRAAGSPRRSAADPIALDRLEEVADDVDVIIASTDSPPASSTPPRSRRSSGVARQRPLCIVDLAVPRDIDAMRAAVPGVTLIDIDELGRRVGRAARQRRRDGPRGRGDHRRRTRATVAAISSATPPARPSPRSSNGPRSCGRVRSRGHSAAGKPTR